MNASTRLWIGLLFLCGSVHAEADILWLGSSGYAPPDAGYYPDSVVAVSEGKINEVGSQVVGLIELARQPYAWSDWPGQSMADCVSIPWGQRCTVETGDVRAHYDFRSNDFSNQFYLENMDLQTEWVNAGVVDGVVHRIEAILGKSAPNGPDRLYWRTRSGTADLFVDPRQSLTRLYWRPLNALVIRPETVLLPLQG